MRIRRSVWRWYLVPYVAMTRDRVVVRGAVTAWAVQESKFSEWTYRHTRADDVVAEIMDRVHDAPDALDTSNAHGVHAG